MAWYPVYRHPAMNTSGQMVQTADSLQAFALTDESFSSPVPVRQLGTPPGSGTGALMPTVQVENYATVVFESELEEGYLKSGDAPPIYFASWRGLRTDAANARNHSAAARTAAESAAAAAAESAQAATAAAQAAADAAGEGAQAPNLLEGEGIDLTMTADGLVVSVTGSTGGGGGNTYTVRQVDGAYGPRPTSDPDVHVIWKGTTKPQLVASGTGGMLSGDSWFKVATP